MLDLKCAYIKRCECHFLFQILTWVIVQIHHLNCCFKVSIVVVIHLKHRKETSNPKEFSVIITENYLLSFDWPQKSLQLTACITILRFSHRKLAANRNYVQATQM